MDMGGHQISKDRYLMNFPLTMIKEKERGIATNAASTVRPREVLSFHKNGHI